MPSSCGMEKKFHRTKCGVKGGKGCRCPLSKRKELNGQHVIVYDTIQGGETVEGSAITARLDRNGKALDVG